MAGTAIHINKFGTGTFTYADIPFTIDFAEGNKQELVSAFKTQAPAIINCFRSLAAQLEQRLHDAAGEATGQLRAQPMSIALDLGLFDDRCTVHKTAGTQCASAVVDFGEQRIVHVDFHG